MRKSVSTNFSAAVASQNFTITWEIFVKKASALNEAQGSGTWIDVTHKINEYSDVGERLEWGLTEFQFSEISFEAFNVDYWQTNIFNSGTYHEIKIDVSVSDDTVTIFAGWIDLNTVVYDERSDGVSFDAFDYMEYANRYSAENLTIQNIYYAIDGTNDGLVLPDLPDFYIVDANIASYVLKEGTHNLRWDSRSGTLSLDDGEGVAIPTIAGNITLSNGDDTERVKIYTKASFIRVLENAEQKIVVTTEGSTIPQTYRYNWQVEKALETLFDEVGVETQTFDTFNLNTHDARKEFSSLDRPGPSRGNVAAMIESGGFLWISTARYIQKRNISTEAYTEIDCTAIIGAGRHIARFWDIGNYLFFVYDKGTAPYRWGMGKIHKTDHTISTLAELTYSNASTSAYNFVYVPTRNKILYVASVGANDYIMAFDTSAETVGTEYNDATGTHNYRGDKAAAKISDDSAYYFVNKISGAFQFYKWTFSGTPSAVPGTSKDVTGAEEAFDEIGIDESQDVGIVLRNISTGNVPLLHVVHFYMGSPYDGPSSMQVLDGLEHVSNFHYSSSESRLYFIGNHKTLYKMENAANTVKKLLDLPEEHYADDTDVNGSYNVPRLWYYSTDNKLFGIYSRNREGILFQYATSMANYVSECDWEGMSVWQAIKEICAAFNLIPKISSTKTAYVYRRGDDTGAIQSTGNTVSITTNEATDLTESRFFKTSFDVVTVSNATKSESYDGAFGARASGNEREIEISNPLFPSNWLKDIAKYMYQYYKTDRHLYEVPARFLIQYEPFDKATVSAAGTKVGVNGTGLIYGQTIKRDGTMSLEVLI